MSLLTGFYLALSPHPPRHPVLKLSYCQEVPNPDPCIFLGKISLFTFLFEPVQISGRTRDHSVFRIHFGHSLPIQTLHHLQASFLDSFSATLTTHLFYHPIDLPDGAFTVLQVKLYLAVVISWVFPLLLLGNLLWDIKSFTKITAAVSPVTKSYFSP